MLMIAPWPLEMMMPVALTEIIAPVGVLIRIPPVTPPPMVSEPPSPVPAPDGTVRVSAEMLENLLSTVSRLMAAQTEMMQLLKTKDPAPGTPASGPAPGWRPASGVPASR